MAANVRITVDLEASQATQVAGKLGQVLAQASINGSRIQVGSPEQVAATNNQATQLNQVVKQILISTERLNIALAKTAKLTFELNRGKGALSSNKKAAYAQFDSMIASSEAAIKQIQQQFIPAVQQVQPAAQQTAKEVNKVGQKAQQAANTGKGAFKGFTSQMKTSMTTAQALMKSFFSPITIAIIAFEAVVKTFTYFWDNLTESIQKMTTRAQTAIKATQRKQKAIEQETKAAQDLVKQLEELNKEQNLSIDQQRLAESIIARLNKQYKDLGITLDQTTGKYKGLYQAQRIIDERNKNSQANALKQQIDAQRNIVNAALANAFGRGINLDKDVIGSDFFTLAEKLGATLGAENADMLAKKWNTKDLAKQLEVIDMLIADLSSSDQVLKNGPEAREALANLIDYRKQLQDLNSVDTQIIEANKRLADSFKAQRDAIKATKEQIEDLNKTFENQQEANSLAQLDPEDRANALRAEIEQLEKRNQQLKKAQQLGQKQRDKATADSYNTQINYDYLASQLKEIEARRNAQAKELKQLEQKIINNRYKVEKWYKEVGSKQGSKIDWSPVQDITEQTVKLDERAKQIRRNQVKDDKQLVQLRKQFNQAQVEHQENTTNILQYEQAISDLEKQRAQNMNEIQAKSQQIAEIEKQIEEARRAAAEAEQQRIDNYNQYVIGLYRKQQQSLNQILGLKKQNLLLETKLNAEKILGRQLTEKELQSLKNYVQINSMIGQFKQGAKLNIGGQQVITNDLARKGGWASSVVVDRAQDINKEILNVQKSQVSLMQKINDTMSKSNDLLKQFSVIQ